MNKPEDFSTDINDAMVFETKEEAEACAREHGLENVQVLQVAEGSKTGDVKRIQ